MYDDIIQFAKKDYPFTLESKIGFLEEAHIFRTKVYERDKMTCQICGMVGRRFKLYKDHEKDLPVLYAHRLRPLRVLIEELGVTQHIQAIVCPEFWDITTAITACRSCAASMRKLSTLR